MEIILNSKFFAELSPAQLGEKTKSFGYDGVDVCVRPGHPVHFGNVATALPEAVAVWRDQGVSCPMVSAPVDFTDPHSADAQALYAACAAAGVPMAKTGYWRFSDGDDYWEVLERARRDLAEFARLGEAHGVKTCCHMHSGQCIGSNCAGLMHLIQGFDARYVGAYADFGHMALDGEDIAMGLSMIRDYLCVVGMKDGFQAHRPGDEPPYGPKFGKLGAGSVDWRRALKTLAAMDFDGPMSVHTEYEFDEAIIRLVGYADAKPPDLETVPREDAAYLRRLLAES